MQVFKFGGASVKDAEGVRNLRDIVMEYRKKPLLIVVSAMGKTTNALEEIASLAFQKESYERQLELLIMFHHQVAMDLFQAVPEELLNLETLCIEKLVQPASRWEQFYDQIVPFGELFSTTIIYQYLKQSFPCAWLDARNYVKTNSFFTEANVEWQLTEHFISRDLPPLLAEGPVITQGFIGSDLTGKTTTLGREGSDYTGAVFAYSLKAESLTVWKDVPGLLNADPKIFPAAELFDELSFQEVTELTYYGAKVIHPKTIRPLAQRGITLYVRSFVNPTGKGTKIYEHEKVGGMHCFVFKENQLLVTLRVKDNSFMDEKKLGAIFHALDHVNIKINLMHNSALTFTFCMDFNKTKIDKVSEYLQSGFQLLYNEGLHLATIKNYTSDSFALLPAQGEFIIEQKTRNNYQVVYRPLNP